MFRLKYLRVMCNKMYLKNRLAQSITEYTLLLSVLIAVLLFMQGQAKWAAWGNLNAIIKDFKDYGFSGKKESVYSLERPTHSTTQTFSKTGLKMGKEAGWRVFIKEQQTDSADTYTDYGYDTYQYLPPSGE